MLFPYRGDNKLQFQNDYEGLLAFIQKNKVIRPTVESYDQLPDSSEVKQNIEGLRTAIKEADFNHSIFSHPDCHLHAISLFKNEKINADEFLTAYFYLMILMQYTDKQPLKKEDEHLKSKGTYQILSIENEDIKNLFLEKMSMINELFDRNVAVATDMDRLNQEIASADKLGKTVFAISKANENEDDAQMMRSMINVTPFVVEDNDYYYFPSAQLINGMARSINPDQPLKAAPVFGLLGTVKLFELHQLGYHPVNLYSPHVVRNLLAPHDIKCGPLHTALHDLSFHIFSGNLIKQNHFNFIMDYLIPKITEIINPDLEGISERFNTDLHFAIDTNFSSLGSGTESWRRNIHSNIFYNCLAALTCNYGHTGTAEKIKIFEALYEDREAIHKKYGIDIVEIMNDPYFSKRNNTLRLTPKILWDKAVNKVESKPKLVPANEIGFGKSTLTIWNEPVKDSEKNSEKDIGMSKEKQFKA